METHQHHQNNNREKVAATAASQLNQENNEQQQQQSSSPSSPSHEFSFTISHNSFSTTLFPDNNKYSKLATPNNNSLDAALDLSPADEIFFHGHLLPLQILSHFQPSSSPRSSTNSMDSFTLPIRELLLEDESETLPTKDSTSTSTSSSNNSSKREESNNNKVEGKSKFAFLLSGLTKGHKGCQVREKEDYKEKHKKKKKKLKFDVIHAVIKKYLRMVKPLMHFRGEREKTRLHKQSYSYSGYSTPRNNNNKQELRGWSGQYSAPASMRTSPSNSGLLLATTALPSPAVSDSTMEELQAAIQAAIAHCKNSFAKEEKLKC